MISIKKLLDAKFQFAFLIVIVILLLTLSNLWLENHNHYLKVDSGLNETNRKLKKENSRLISVIKELNQDKTTSIEGTLSINEATIKPIDNPIDYSPHWKVFSNGEAIHVGHEPHEYHFNYLHSPNNDTCSTWSSNDGNKLRLIIIVKSNVVNYERREAYRETTGSKMQQEALNYRVVFLLGIKEDDLNSSESISIQNKIHQESITFGDIIQVDVKESFRNLTLKSIASLEWYINYCPSAHLTLSTDDDIYTHAPNLMEQLDVFSKSDKMEDHITCHINSQMPILRAEKDDKIFAKYFVTEEEMPGQIYPDYCSGFEYAFSLNVAKNLHTQALLTPYIFIDDAFTTGICRVKANVGLVQNDNFKIGPAMTEETIHCDLKNGRITSSQLNPEQIRKNWKALNTRVKNLNCNK